MTAEYLQSFPPMLSDETVHALFIWESRLTRLPGFLLAKVGSPTPQEWARLKPWEEGAKVSQRVDKGWFPGISFARMASGNSLSRDPGVSAALSTGTELVQFIGGGDGLDGCNTGGLGGSALGSSC